MKTLVDTSAWSFFLRRRPLAAFTDSEERVRGLVVQLLQGQDALVLGVVRQELLSGVRTDAHFRRVRDFMRSVPDTLVTTADHEDAAAHSNRCRQFGIAGSPADLLLCTVAIRLEAPILTLDRDFLRFREHIPIKLVEV